MTIFLVVPVLSSQQNPDPTGDPWDIRETSTPPVNEDNLLKTATRGIIKCDVTNEKPVCVIYIEHLDGRYFKADFDIKNEKISNITIITKSEYMEARRTR